MTYRIPATVVGYSRSDEELILIDSWGNQHRVALANIMYVSSDLGLGSVVLVDAPLPLAEEACTTDTSMPWFSRASSRFCSFWRSAWTPFRAERARRLASNIGSGGSSKHRRSHRSHRHPLLIAVAVHFIRKTRSGGH